MLYQCFITFLSKQYGSFINQLSAIFSVISVTDGSTEIDKLILGPTKWKNMDSMSSLLRTKLHPISMTN